MVLFNRVASGEGIAAKLASIAQHVPTMRWIIALELITFVDAVSLAVALYGLTRDEDQELAVLALSCRVGGGIRSIERAQDVLAAGAQQIIAGSALFKDGRPDLEFAKRLSDAIGMDRVIAAVDSSRPSDRRLGLSANGGPARRRDANTSNSARPIPKRANTSLIVNSRYLVARRRRASNALAATSKSGRWRPHCSTMRSTWSPTPAEG